MKVLLMFLLLIFVAKSQRVECDWRYEYLCGDQCTNNEKVCHCGQTNMTRLHSATFTCCNQSPCVKDSNENVQCFNGQKQGFWTPCHGKCQQWAKYGYTGYECESQNQCFIGVWSCQGSPKCAE